MGRVLDRRRAAANPIGTATKCVRPAEGTDEGVADGRRELSLASVVVVPLLPVEFLMAEFMYCQGHR
jgi:hypothetical protein